jgi:hypothetical protein
VAKDGKGKKDKSKKNKVPKQVAGVKVPKKLRKLGNQAVKAVNDPAVSEVVAGALLAAAAALREGKDPKSVVGAAMKSGVKGVTGGAGLSGGTRLSDGLKLLALDFARRALDGMQDAKAKRDSAAEAEADEAAAPVPAAGAGEVRAEEPPEAAPPGSQSGRAPGSGQP